MFPAGIYSSAQLREEGLTRHRVDRLVRDGSLKRVTSGWYASAEADPAVVSAIKAGGRLGCLSGCALHGLWVPPQSGTHVVFGAGATARRGPGLVLHPDSAPQPRGAVWPVWDCVRHVARRHDPESAVIVAESAINLRLLTVDDARQALAALPVRHARLQERLAPAQSGSETRVRLFFASRHVPVTAQHHIDGVGWVDLLVGDRLIVECDSHAHHGETNYENDRRRDLAARDRGYTTLRLSYQQIWLHWPATQQSLIREIRARRHIRRAR